MEVNVIPTISPEKSAKNTFFKSAEAINLVTFFVSPMFKVTSKIAIQYNISPFIYLHIRQWGQFISWLPSKCRISHLFKLAFILNMSLKVTSKMTHEGRHLYVGSSLWKKNCIVKWRLMVTCKLIMITSLNHILLR